MDYIYGNAERTRLELDQQEYGRKMMTLEERLAPNKEQTRLNGRKIFAQEYGWGIVVGGYINDSTSLYIFKALHVRFNSGVSTTINMDKVLKIARA